MDVAGNNNTEQCVDIIRKAIGDMPIDVGLVLGTGLSGIADQITQPVAIPYDALPGFPLTGDDVHDPLHPKELVIGTLGSARVAVFRGRSNYNEAGDINAMRVPMETLAQLGARAVLLTGAVGSVRNELQPGALVTITDHINLTGINPLIGEQKGEGLVDMAGLYDRHLRERFGLAAAQLGRKIYDGVLMWFPGPSFETVAEIRAAQALGADLVGMSMVPEAVLARRFGLRVLGLAMVTTLAAGLRSEPVTREMRQRTGAAAISSTSRVLSKFFEIWQVESRGLRQI